MGVCGIYTQMYLGRQAHTHTLCATRINHMNPSTIPFAAVEPNEPTKANPFLEKD